MEAPEDPFAREYFGAERNKSIEKRRRRRQQQQQQEWLFSPSNDIGGLGSDLPEY